MTERPAPERGFSLIELMVAMTVTLIITGAIYGLIASGGNAFRREPSLTERQQNIRLAMDVIVRDIESAGGSPSAFDTTFTDNLNNPAANSWPAATVTGENADFLEMITIDGNCPSITVCKNSGAALFTSQAIPQCFYPQPPPPGFTGFVGYLSGPNGGATKTSGAPPTGVLFLTPPGGAMANPAGCPPSAGHVDAPSNIPLNNNGGNYTCNGGACDTVTLIQWVRYQIAACDPADPVDSTVPCLWRTPLGSTDASGAATAAPAPPAAPWQMVARGIEDLQVEYRLGTGGWVNTPGAPAAGNYNSVVRQVRVTLSARALAANLGTAGGGLQTARNAGTTAKPNPAAVRGRLTSVVTPRATLRNLLALNASPRPSPQPWN